MYQVPNDTLLPTADSGHFMSKSPVILATPVQTRSDAAIQAESITKRYGATQGPFIEWYYDELEGVLQELERLPVPPHPLPTLDSTSDMEADELSNQMQWFL